jgi:DNA-directed RNA polymerase specialized sigma24 family protein
MGSGEMAKSSEDFAELMRLVQNGDSTAAAELHRRFAPAIQRAVHHKLHPRLRGKFDSADFTQDAWTSFFADPGAHGDLGSPDHFVRVMKCIALNKITEATRQRLEGKKFNVQQEHSLNSSFLNGAVDVPADQPTPSQILMSEEQWQLFLRGQPLVHQRILKLLRKGKQPTEIADRLGLSSRTIYRLISRMLERTGPPC